MIAHVFSSALCPSLAMAPPGQENPRGPSHNIGVEEHTVFRTWHVKDCDDAVPALEKTMSEAGLSSYMTAAGEWCREVGAALLQEVQEELDDFCADLGLAAPLKQRLSHSISTCVAEEARKHVDPQVQPLLQRASVECLVWTDSKNSPESSASGGGLARTDTCVSTEGGLRDVLVGAELESYIAVAEAWCLDMGAAFLEEVLEEIDTFGEDIQLTEHQCWQLREVLDFYITDQGSRMTNMNTGAQVCCNHSVDDYMSQGPEKGTNVTACCRNINESRWQCLENDVHTAD